MALYDTRFGLPQSTINYLNQPLPDISGIFSLPQVSQSVVPSEEITESLAPTGLTLEQLRLLYPQYNLGGGGGEGRDDEDIDRSENLGINSLADLGNFVNNNLGTIASSLAFGPVPTMIGRGIGKLYENFRNPYSDIFGRVNQATQAAINRELQRDLQDRMDRGEVDFSGGISAAQDAARGGQYSGGDGPSGGGKGSGATGRDAGMGMGGKQR